MGDAATPSAAHAPDDLVQRLIAGEHTDARAALYAELRAHGEVIAPGAFPGYVAIGYEWCRDAMRTNALQKLTTTQVGQMLVGLQPPEPGLWATPLPPDQQAEQRRLKLVFASMFAARHVRGYEAAFRQIADEEIATVEPGVPYDVMNGFALRIPGRFISQKIGFSDEDFERIQPLVHDVVLALEPWADRETYARGAESAKQITVALNPVLRARKTDPRADLVSRLLHDQEGEPLSKRVITALCIMAYTAGYETTMSLIGNTILTLARTPGLFDRVKADPSLVPALVEESMRYESPTHFTPRLAIEPVEIRGCRLEVGDIVVITIGAAHHDPEVFPHPERFDLGRPQGKVLTFAPGPAHCCGESLGRLEAETVVQKVIERFSSIELLDDEIAWRPGILLHSAATLDIRFN